MAGFPIRVRHQTMVFSRAGHRPECQDAPTPKFCSENGIPIIVGSGVGKAKPDGVPFLTDGTPIAQHSLGQGLAD